MTYEELQDAVRVRLGVPASDNFFTADVLGSLVNEALQAISTEMDWPWLDATTTFATVSGTQTYTPPTNWIRTKSLIVTAPDQSFETISWRSLQEVREYGTAATEQGYPNVYTVWAEQILLAPVPGAAYTVRHDYVKQEPALQANTNAPVMPQQFHYSIVQHAVYLAHLRQGDMARANAAQQAYQSWFKRMADHDKRVTVPMRVRVRPGRAV